MQLAERGQVEGYEYLVKLSSYLKASVGSFSSDGVVLTSNTFCFPKIGPLVFNRTNLVASLHLNLAILQARKRWS